MGKPLKFTVVNNDEKFPDGTEKAVAHAQDEKHAIQKLELKVCVEDCFYRPSSIVTASSVTIACTTGKSAMQLTLPCTKGSGRGLGQQP